MLAQEKVNIRVDIMHETLNTTIYPLNNAETIILLHGGHGVSNKMEQVAKMLNEKCQVIYFEQRGTENSYCPHYSYTMEDCIPDINAITEYYKLDAFHLFGHSWSGLYAQIYTDGNAPKNISLFLWSPSSGTNKSWEEMENEVMAYNKIMASIGEWFKMGWISLLGVLGSNNAYRRLFRQVFKNYHKYLQDSESPEEELAEIFADPINKYRKEIIDYRSLKKVQNSPFPISISYVDHDIYGRSKIKLIERFSTTRVYEIKGCGYISWLYKEGYVKKDISECCEI